MTNQTLCFIGAGNMARSLIGGLLADGWPAGRICATDTDPDQRDTLTARFGITSGDDNGIAAQTADVVVLAVKPQVMHTVAEEIAAAVQTRRPLVISIAAGIRATDLERWLGGNAAIVRCMPNTPALVQSGATALFANPRVSTGQRDLAESILRAVGLTLWLDREDLMDAVTA
ncbi:pyrroline-5-carboxylate reductase family protein, partial [Oceanibaculum nanhaiense]|uniref:pyrroline-5-carboxylate reductase family protein n=1 Tax=Oceanibaculum nanhaiense TaxID=1909734 RepID=UPI00396E2587